MIPGQIANLAMYRPADFVFQDTIYQADGSSPQNISGWTVRFQLLAYGDPGTVYLTKAASVVNAVAGVLNIAFASADTANFNAGQYEYSVTRTDLGSFTPCLSAGLFTLLGSANSPN